MLRYKDVLPKSTIAIHSDMLPENVRDGLDIKPVPLTNHVGIPRDQFPEACKRMGVRASRAGLEPTSLVCVYTLNAARAWSPAAALFYLMRRTWFTGDTKLERATRYDKHYHQELSELLNRRRQAAEAAKRLTEAGKNLETSDDFDWIVNNPDIESIEVKPPHIIITTKILKMKDVSCKRAAARKLGRVKIKFSVQHDCWVPNFHNLDHRPRGWSHPHVDDAGRPCLGNTSSGFRELHNAYNWRGYVGLCLEYLKWYNGHDASRWPLATKPRKRKKKKS